MNNREKLQNLIDQIDTLTKPDIDPYSAEFESWYKCADYYLETIFGKKSPEYEHFTEIKFHSKIRLNPETESETCNIGLQTAKQLLKKYIEKIEVNDKMPVKSKNNTVFIVHGHDEAVKYQISNTLRKINLNPIILHEQGSQNDTIIEKLERYAAEASAAIILFTPDDFGNVKTAEDKKLRARQNVVFEAGYFMGLLGRKNTILVVTDNTIELPGDLQGIVYSQNDEMSLCKELRSIGLDVDLNLL